VILETMQEDDLDNLHHAILDQLHEGRITPSYAAKKTGESRQLISSRLRDLVMAGHVQKIHKGLYELVEDPRKKSDERTHDVDNQSNS